MRKPLAITAATAALLTGLAGTALASSDPDTIVTDITNDCCDDNDVVDVDVLNDVVDFNKNHILSDNRILTAE